MAREGANGIAIGTHFAGSWAFFDHIFLLADFCDYRAGPSRFESLKHRVRVRIGGSPHPERGAGAEVSPESIGRGGDVSACSPEWTVRAFVLADALG